MTVLEVICKTVTMQNNSQWPCSMCPIPQFRLMGVRTSHIFNISWTSWVLDPITNPSFGGPLAEPSYTTINPPPGSILYLQNNSELGAADLDDECWSIFSLFPTSNVFLFYCFVTNHHKLGGLKLQTFISSQFCRSNAQGQCGLWVLFQTHQSHQQSRENSNSNS